MSAPGDAISLSVTELQQALRSRELSAVEIADAYLEAAAASPLNAFLDIQPELTRRQARDADAALAAGTAKAAGVAGASGSGSGSGAAGAGASLLGLPVAHKDIFVTRGWRSTAGSRMLADYSSPFDAAVVERIAAAGAVCLGKLNCDEFAMGSANENPVFGAVRNPWDTGRIAGGSSGGSAAAVAAGLAPFATGTDTGGSVRQPAAMCGVTGIKPTYGRVSRYGMIAYASSLDQGGVIARSAEECALLLQAMVGFDARDSTSLQLPHEDLVAACRAPLTAQATESAPLAGLRIGLPDEFFGPGVAADVRQAVDAGVAALVALGAEAVPVSLPRTELSIPAYYVIAPAEASSNLSRFDGVRYGHRASDYTDLRDMYMRTRAEGFGTEVKRRIVVGTYVLSHGYYDAYYVKAQQLRRMIADDFARVFGEVDLVAGPVAPTTAWRIGEQTDDPVRNYLSDIFTLPASLAGLPAMSLPCGFGAGRLPVGLQLIAPYLQDARLLAAACALQRATGWHLERPPASREPR